MPIHNLLSNRFGQIAFYCLWPLVWLYAPTRQRVRVLVVDDNKILLIKNKFGSGKWQLPGGGIDFGETPIAAAVREFKEELDSDLLDPKEMSAVTELVIQNGLFMRYRYVNGSVVPDHQFEITGELSDFQWFELEDLNQIRYEAEVTRALNLQNL